MAGVIATSLAAHRFPEGPLLLKDFGVDEQKVLEEGHVEHKIRAAWLRDAPGGDAKRADAALARVASVGAETLRFSDVAGARAWALERGWIEEDDAANDDGGA